MTSSHAIEGDRFYCTPSGKKENVYRLAEELKLPERKILDFSFPVNPLGVSKKMKAELRQHLKYLHIYPDPEARRLRKRLSQYHGIDPEMILCGNGSSELLRLVLKGVNPQRVLIPAPENRGYEKAVLRVRQGDKGAGIHIIYHQSERSDNFQFNAHTYIDALRNVGNPSPLSPDSSPSAGLAFLCNPNSVTGRLTGKDVVRKIAEAAKENRCYLIVDEAFIDFCPGESVIEAVAENPYLIVLRTMTYFHALAGIGIGYGIFAKELAGELSGCREPWTINSLSQRVAAIALKDKVYQNETCAVIREEKRFLESNFMKLGIEFLPSDANFYLVRSSKAREISNRLKARAILLGECSDIRGLDDTYLRVAVKSHKENAVLIKELAKLIGKGR
jgi:threonine-phosphate decarboxylase